MTDAFSGDPQEWDDATIARAIHTVRTLRLFSWNIWLGGAKVDDGHRKQAEVLAPQGADIVFLQECAGDAGAQLGRSLGMTVAQQDYDTAVLSSAPMRLLPTSTAPYATAALVESRIGPLIAWSVHLEHRDYGPYRADELPGLRPGTGLTVVSWLMRLGFLLSPPLVGFIAETASLRLALLVVPVAGMLVMLTSWALAKRNNGGAERT